MVPIPMETLGAAEVSSLMPLLYHGKSPWSFWRREHKADCYLLFMTSKILVGLLFFFFLLFSSTSSSNLSQRSLVWNSLPLEENCFSLLLIALLCIPTDTHPPHAYLCKQLFYSHFFFQAEMLTVHIWQGQSYFLFSFRSIICNFLLAPPLVPLFIVFRPPPLLYYTTGCLLKIIFLSTGLPA